MKNIIYALIDPRNDLVCYIGKSTVGEKRPLTHLFNSHSEGVNNWINELSQNWFYPKIVIIEEVDDLNLLPEKEVYWIDYYSKINHDLLNNHKVNKDHINYDVISKEEMERFEVVSSSIGNIEVMFKKQRMARNISQEVISELMGISRSTLSLFERGQNVTIDILKKYNLALKQFDIKSKIVNKERVR